MGYWLLTTPIKKTAVVNRPSTVILWTLLMTLISSFETPTGATGEPILVIINKENPVNALTQSEVKLYYLRKIKKRWPAINKNIRPAELKRKSSERDAFYQAILGMKEDEVVQYFVNKQLQNAERPQDKFATEVELINFVSEEPGAIAYIKASSLTNEMKAKVKVVCTFSL
jgi:ABC-type phosphate transport system substrate-binding protein